MTRRTALITVSAGAVALASAIVRGQAKPAKTPILVFKDPSCGCCAMWVDHMTSSGFVASVTNTEMKPIKARYKVPEALESCHTSTVGGYVIEGHVPAEDVRKLLATKPAGVIGLTIPGMPASAPGMDQLPFRPYDVLTFDANGRTTVFAKHTKG